MEKQTEVKQVYKQHKLRDFFNPADWVNKGFDYSRKEDKQYMEIEPFSVNEETGEVLNNTKYKKIVRIGNKNFYDEIQSYASDCDIYSLLDKQKGSSQLILPNGKQVSFEDYLNLPNNLADLKYYLDNLSPEEKKAIMSSKDDVKTYFDNIMRQLLIEQMQNKIPKEEVKE